MKENEVVKILREQSVLLESMSHMAIMVLWETFLRCRYGVPEGLEDLEEITEKKITEFVKWIKK